MSEVRLRGEVRMAWQTLLDAVVRHVVEVAADELSEYDAERLIAAGNNVLYRLHRREAERRKT